MTKAFDAQMRKGFEEARAKGYHVDYFTWQIAYHDAMLAAAPTPAAQSAGQEPMAQVAEDFIFFLRKQPDGSRWPVGTKLYATPFAAPVNGGERECKCDMRTRLVGDGCDVCNPGHSDDEAVDLFAQAMKAKMADARAKGRSGWETCEPETLSTMLREHVEKGDPRDVANFCMMLWHHRKPISAADAQQVNVQPAHEQAARFAIDGAISLGMQGVKQPDADHWLAKYWDIGRQLAAKVGGDEREAFDLKDFEASLWALVEMSRSWEKAYGNAGVSSADLDTHKTSVERELRHLVSLFRTQIEREASTLRQFRAFHRAALSADGGDAIDVFFDEVKAELRRARAKFPGDRIMTLAAAEEFGELCKAVLDEPAANVRKEAVQTAVMCARVVLDGDGSVNEWRAQKGLDPLSTAAIAAAKEGA